MARQNVGKPRFYIDYIQYWYHKGLIWGIGPYGDEGYGGDLPNGVGWVNDVNPGGSGWHPELIGFTPYDYLEMDRHASSSATYFPYIILFKERVHFPSSGKMFVSHLNHNFSSAFIGPTGAHLLKFYRARSPYGNLDEWFNGTYDGEQDTWEAPSTSYSYWEALWLSSTTGNTPTEIVNAGAGGEKANYDGFTIMEFDTVGFATNDFDETFPDWDSITPWGSGVDIINLFHDTSLTWAQMNAEPYNNTIPIILGSINIGYIYEMTHSANLSLTMERVYDGIQSEETIGGSRLTNINYHSAPNWRGGDANSSAMPPWGLKPTESWNVNFPSKNRAAPSRGRRVWNLEFEYFSSSDLFALNDSLFYANPTDSPDSDASGNLSSGYESTDFDAVKGTFLENIETDTSFFGTVIDKTMGGQLPFLFQPDSNNSSPDQYAICVIDQDSIIVEQVAFNTYNIALRIREVW